jgi:tripartite-type tricarboxylate transporter receptor subunit TctC
MKPFRNFACRTFKVLSAGLSAVLSATLLTHSAHAQTWPDKPIRMIIPAAAGTSTDIIGRELGQRLGQALGQPVVLENVAGAGGAPGTERAAKSAPDGYTLVLGTIGTHSINPSIYPKLGYDSIKDFAPLAFVGYTPMLVVASPGFAANNIGELVALAKAQPGKLSFASSGSGTGNHLAGELLKTLAKVEMTHVPYKSGAQAVTDVASGQVSFMFYHIPAVGQHVKSGRLKALALASIRRSPAMPQAVPVAEQGFPGFEVNPWWMLYAPAGTPAPILARLRTESAKIIAQPDYQERLAGQGVETETMTPEKLAAFTGSELTKWAAVVKASGARAD